MSNPDLNCFVNLEAYPIDRLDSEAGQELLNRAHRMMKEDTLVEFPDFLRSQAVVALAEELTALESSSRSGNVIDRDCSVSRLIWISCDSLKPIC